MKIRAKMNGYSIYVEKLGPVILPAKNILATRFIAKINNNFTVIADFYKDTIETGEDKCKITSAKKLNDAQKRMVISLILKSLKLNELQNL